MASLTVQMPEKLLRSLQRRASQSRQPVGKEVVELIESALSQADLRDTDITELLQPLETMTDDDLWNAAESRLPKTLARKLESLHSKRQREGLTKAEREQARTLAQQYERGVLIRAQAAALLKARGHDVARLLPS